MIWLIFLMWITFILVFILVLNSGLVSKEDNRIVIWPEYLDKNLPKSRGRRVPLKLATNNPTVEEIAKAAKRLKLIPKIEANKAYPGRWWRHSGRVLIKTTKNKTKIIKQIAIVVKKYKKQ